MRQSNFINCPYCGKEQLDNLDILVEGAEMEGSFEHICDSEKCEKAFTVEFEYRPFNRSMK